MYRELGSLVRISVLTSALVACVGPQYDATPDFGEDAAFATDTETEGEIDTAAGEELCPRLVSNGDDVDAARAAFVQGTSAYVGGQYTDAVLAFCRAYAAKPHYAIMYNIAKCETELGDFARAIDAYELFLDEIARLRRAPPDGE